MGVENVIEHNGIGIAITGMAIVFVVLVLVSLFIGWLPRLLPIVNGILPPVEHHHGAPMPSATPRTPSAQTAASNEGDVIAAIGFAMHHHRGG